MSGVLDGISDLVAEYMFDSIRIYRITGRSLNQATLKYDNITEDRYVGKAFVGSNATPATQTVGSEPVARTQYEVGYPLIEGDPPSPGLTTGDPTRIAEQDDYIEVLASVYDPTLVGRVLKVIGSNVSTFSVHRRTQARLDDSPHD